MPDYIFTSSVMGVLEEDTCRDDTEALQKAQELANTHHRTVDVAMIVKTGILPQWCHNCGSILQDGSCPDCGWTE